MPESRISNIEQTVGGDGVPLWIISFEGKKLTLTERQEPTYKIGDILPFNVRVVKPPEGQRWYYVRADGAAKPQFTPQTRKPQFTKSPKNDNDIMIEVALKEAGELDRHHIVPEGKVDTDRIKRTAQDLLNWMIEMRGQLEQ